LIHPVTADESIATEQSV